MAKFPVWSVYLHSEQELVEGPGVPPITALVRSGVTSTEGSAVLKLADCPGLDESLFNGDLFGTEPLRLTADVLVPAAEAEGDTGRVRLTLVCVGPVLLTTLVR